MRKFIVLCSILLSWQSFSKSAVGTPEAQTGIGFTLGIPTGVSFNHFFDKNVSFDGLFSYKSSNTYNKMTLFGGLVFHFPEYYFIDLVPLNLYYGIGAELSHKNWDDKGKDDETLIGPRISGGSGHWFEQVPIELNLEGALVFSIIEETEVDFEIFVLGRYYF
ncbi:MAG: hypothetical protein H6621_05235 [Halobacteriovoraceae bacterium]|nr:hypothetical protein [Halobacteriovoraceae bacterium]